MGQPAGLAAARKLMSSCAGSTATSTVLASSQDQLLTGQAYLLSDCGLLD